MKYQELISYEKKYGKCDNDLIIVIPCFINYDILIRHLGYLSKQTFQKFDVVIVLGPNFNDAKLFEFLKNNNFDFGIIAIKRKEDTGSAGGFFTGQKYGFEKGYAYMINADDDCMPTDPDLMKNLYGNKDYDYVSPTILLQEGTVTFNDNFPSIAQYTLFSRKILQKYGLCYAPLYYYSEDIEYRNRIKEKRIFIPNIAVHPLKRSNSYNEIKNSRVIYRALNSVYSLEIRYAIRYLLTFCYTFSVYLLFFQEPLKKNAINAIKSLLSFKYGKEVFDELNTRLEGQSYLKISKNVKTIPDENVGLGANTTDPHYKQKKILNLMKSSFENFRKEIIVENTYYFKLVMLSILAKKIYLKSDNEKMLLMSDNSSIIFHIVKLIFFPFFLFLCVLLIPLIYLPIRVLKKPNTIGYGLD